MSATRRHVGVEARERATLDNGSLAPPGTAGGSLFCPCYFREASETRLVADGAVIPAKGCEQLTALAGGHWHVGWGLHPTCCDQHRLQRRGAAACVQPVRPARTGISLPAAV